MYVKPDSATGRDQGFAINLVGELISIATPLVPPIESLILNHFSKILLVLWCNWQHIRFWF